jgi:hypothetical protein
MTLPSDLPFALLTRAKCSMHDGHSCKLHGRRKLIYL